MPEEAPSRSAARSADSKPLEPHFRLASAYAGQLAWALAVCAILTAVCLYLGYAEDLASVRALGLHLLLLTGVLAALWRMAWLRGAVSVERDERADRRRQDEERAKAGRGSLFAEEPEGIPRHWTSEYVLEGYAYIRQRILLVAVALAAGVLSFICLTWPIGKSESRLVPLAALLAGVIGFICVLASRYFAVIGKKGLREAPALSAWLRGVTWLAFGALLSLAIAIVFKYERWVHLIDGWVARVILAWTALCAVELLVRTVIGLAGQRRPFEEVEVPLELVSVQLAFARANPLSSFTGGLERYLGISLQASWGLKFLGRSFVPLACLLLLILWGMTCLEVVHPHEQGILEHWGRYTGEPLQPGLYLKYPWPVDRIHHFPAMRVAEINLGHDEGHEGEGEHHGPVEFILWSRPHGDEYKLILNEGRELLSLGAQIYYRIRNVKEYAYGVQNPDEALEALAYREVVQGILPFTLHDLMSEHRGSLPRVLQERIQAAADDEGLGMEILKVTFVGLHPPVDVAKAYQDVVGAQIDFETMQLFEEAVAAKDLPSAAAEAMEIVRGAEMAAVRRVAEANGRAAAFRSLVDAYRENPPVFRTMRGLQNFEEALGGKAFIVKDDALDTAGFQLHIINLRQGLPLWPFGRRRVPG